MPKLGMSRKQAALALVCMGFIFFTVAVVTGHGPAWAAAATCFAAAVWQAA